MYSSLKCVAMVDTLITKIAAHQGKKGLKVVLILWEEAVWSEEDLSFLSKYVPECFLLAQRHFEIFWTIYSSLLFTCLMQENRDNIFIPVHTSISPFPFFPHLLVNRLSPIQHWAEPCFQGSAHSPIWQQAKLFPVTELCCICILKRFLRFFFFIELPSDHFLWKRNLSPDCVSRQVSWLQRHCKLLLV